jgi:hypothetical protein
MNNFQKLWWEQARSDHKAFLLLLDEDIAQCHSLHYLQMVTEKLAKAYLWRSGDPPPRSHAGFVQFMRFLGQVRRENDRERIAALFSFNRFTDFKKWIRTILPICYDLERLAPDLANEGPNPEYPWPHAQPQFAPANYKFAIWNTLQSGQGRDLIRVIGIAVDRFPEYADI